MKYSGIKKHDVANGPGIRVSLFVSGCRHHCPGCFNPDTWSFEFGDEFTDANVEEIMDALAPDYVKGLTVLGGEPFEPENQPHVLELIKECRKRYPEKNIWCYSGYLFDEEIVPGKLGDPAVTSELIRNIDVLVDGEFHLAEKDLKLRFRGSANQRIIDVPKSLKAGEIINWDED